MHRSECFYDICCIGLGVTGCLAFNARKRKKEHSNFLQLTFLFDE